MNYRSQPERFSESSLSVIDGLSRIALRKGLHQIGRASDAHWVESSMERLISRAAVSPTSVGNSAALNQVKYEFLDALVPQSAGAALLRSAVQVSFEGATAINLPGVSLPSAKFVAEGAPFPVQQMVSSASVSVAPYKLGVMTAVTSELFVNLGAEAAIRQVLIESIGPSLDAVLLGTAAAVPQTQPAGLLNGITPLTASTASPGSEAMFDDVEKLGQAVSQVAGNGAIALVAASREAISLAVRPTRLMWPVYASSSLAAGTVVCVALNGLVASAGVPTIDVSTQAAVHMDDNALALVSASPVTIAAPIRGSFQSDTLILKVRMPVTWALRSPIAIAYITGAAW
jgi:hypothetical protein